jgi:photosystem II stability/assembly factor-like uncharacterized protein
MKCFYFLTLFCFSIGFAQIQPSSSEEVSGALKSKAALSEQSLFKNIPFKSIGPTVMSGRVADLEVNPDDATEFYVGYASGGVWHTINNGTTFTPIMDNAPSINVGDIGIHWPSRTIWVGTGENISSRSSYSGIGMLKTTDNGQTWEHKGLKDAHHFGRILVHPTNPNEIVVGVTGSLYSPNEERGMYKTTDGGATWQNTLFINDATGIIDVACAPNDFAKQYAAAWEKDRKAWDFTGSGNASGMYKSTDAGNTWVKISTPESGFPTGEGIGRIGFAVYDENTVYAVHDNQFRRPKTSDKKSETKGLEKNDFTSMSNADFQKLDAKELDAFLKDNRFPKTYTAATVTEMIVKNEIKPADIARYLGEDDPEAPDTPVIGAEVYRSDDAGKTWKKQNEDYIDDLFYSYGYVFAQVRVDASNKDKIYLLGVPIIKSSDAGKTYTSIQKENVHVDHHSLWINPKRPGHLINGNDGGLNISYDDGENWTKNNSESVGTFFAVNIDHQEPYNVYGGLQDNGVWMGPHNAKSDFEWQQTGHHPWKGVAGGDGMQIQIDSRNPDIIFTGSQFGYYSRIDVANDKRTFIKPTHKLGEEPYRFNWESPILLSSHNQDILYFGTNKFMRSMDQGDTWEAISPDLTAGGRRGNVPYGTLTTISESSLQFGLLYSGSDDGKIQVSKNGGSSWEEIGKNVDLSGFKNLTGLESGQKLWVAQVLASTHKKERAYVALSGYRYDDFTTYLFKSEDYGNTWKSISANIPNSPMNVIIEDPENENLLFAGTDNGLYASINQGKSWETFQNDMPNVAIHDLVIQPESKHLIIATHGRGIYKSDIAPLQLMTPMIVSKDLHVFDVENINHSSQWGNSWSSWMKANTPGLDLTFYSSKADTFTATVKTDDDILVSATEVKGDKGLNVLSYDVAFSKIGKMNYLKKHKTKLDSAKDGKTYLPKGNYTIELMVNGGKETKTFTIE